MPKIFLNGQFYFNLSSKTWSHVFWNTVYITSTVETLCISVTQMNCKHSATYGSNTSVARRICIIYVLSCSVRMNTMNWRDCAGLIAPCRVQLLSLNQPCAAISGVRRAKRLQPAISFRLSAAIKHPSSICDHHSGGHASARRACAGTVSGNSAAWQAPGAMLA